MRKSLAALFLALCLCVPMSVQAKSDTIPSSALGPVIEEEEPALTTGDSIQEEDCDVIYDPNPTYSGAQTTASDKRIGEWKKLTDGWYFIYNGKPVKNGEYTIDKEKYRFLSTGCMVTGWHLNADKTWNYYRTDGRKVVASWICKDGYWYYFDKKGLLNYYLILWNNRIYYANEKGQMQIGWIHNPEELDAKVIYADNSGKLCEGWKNLKGEDGKKHWYYFWPDVDNTTHEPYGLATSTWITDASGQKYWVNEKGIWE